MASSLTLLHSLPKQSKLLPLTESKTSSRMPPTVILLQMCHTVQEIRQLHAQFVISGLLNHPLNPARLLQSYVAASQLNYAISVFNKIPSPDQFAYNTMIRGLTMDKSPYESVLLYKELLLNGVVPDNYTYTFVLKTCSHLKSLSEGQQVHCRIVKAGIVPDTHVYSSLIRMYSNCGCIDYAERILAAFSEENNTVVKNSIISGYLCQGLLEEARVVFDNMTVRDVASWSAMITGYTNNGLHVEALTLFQDMMVSRVVPNESTLVSLLSACANLGALHQGRWVHAYIGRIGAELSVPLGTALINMYAKCGNINGGFEVFRKMPRIDIGTWGAIMAGFTMDGQATKCFELFDLMVSKGTLPNEIILVTLLSACSHAGFVNLGYHYFNQMVDKFGIKPSIEHYGCMVDLLGRAGYLADAEKLIASMPDSPNSVILGTLLSACRIHNDFERGRRVFKSLVELEPQSGDRYKQAGLMFASGGDYGEAARISKLIKEKELETTCGSSVIEVEGTIHHFVVGDIHHEKVEDIYRVLDGDG